jgi:hypothetical protein
MEKSKSFIFPETTPHPLRAEIKKHGLALWQVRLMIDNATSESSLSRALRGIIPLPPDLEKTLADALSMVNR